MFFKKTAAFTFALLVLLLGLSGCNSAESKIVGKWNPEGAMNQMVYDFRPNGAVTAGRQPGKYTFDGTRMKLQTQTATFMYEVSFVADDRMIWRNADGSQTELRKIE